MDLNPSFETPPTAPPARTRQPATITPQEVTKIGQRLYGQRHWMPRLAEALNTNRTTISRWSRGLSAPYPAAVSALRRLDAEHRAKKAAERAMRA